MLGDTDMCYGLFRSGRAVERFQRNKVEWFEVGIMPARDFLRGNLDIKAQLLTARNTGSLWLDRHIDAESRRKAKWVARE
jgi:hypothetical protein